MLNSRINLIIYVFILCITQNTSLLSVQDLQEQLQSLQEQLEQLNAALPAIAKAPAEDINKLFQEKLNEIEKDFATAQEYSSKSFKPKVKEFFDFNWQPNLTEEQKRKAKDLKLKDTSYYFYMVTHLKALLFSIGGMGDYFTKNNITQPNKTNYIKLLNNIELLARKTDTYLKGYRERLRKITPALNAFDPSLLFSIQQYLKEVEKISSSITKSKDIILEALKGNR